MDHYRILRFYSDGRTPKRIKVFSSLREAAGYCNNNLTKGELKSGVKWFDGFTKIEKAKAE